MDTLNLSRRCPKCGGNLFLYNDHKEWYEQCLQCSFTIYLDIIFQNNKTKEMLEPESKVTSKA